MLWAEIGGGPVTQTPSRSNDRPEKMQAHFRLFIIKDLTGAPHLLLGEYDYLLFIIKSGRHENFPNDSINLPEQDYRLLTQAGRVIVSDSKQLFSLPRRH